MYISSKLLLLISTPSKNRVVVLPDLLEVIWLFDRFLKRILKNLMYQVADFGVPASM